MYMKMEEQFKIGDVVRLKDGDGRHHIIKDIIDDSFGDVIYKHVIFEDDAAKDYIIFDDGILITNMVKIK